MKNIFEEASGAEWTHDLRTVWLLTRQHLFDLVVAVLSGLALSGVNGAIAWLVKPSLDGLFAQQNRRFLVFLPLGILVLFVVRGAVGFFNGYLMSSVGAKIVRSLRIGVYQKLLRLPMSFFSQKVSGSIISRVINDIGSLENSIAHTAKNLVVQSASALVLAGVALYRRWDLALLSFVVIPGVILVADGFGRKMKRTSANTRKLVSNVTKTIQETLLGIRVIKSFTMERGMQQRSDFAITEHYRNVMREVRILEFADSLMEVIAGAGVAMILWYGSYLILNNKMDIGEFFSFVVAVLMMYDPLKRLSRLNNNFQVIRTSLHRIREIMVMEEERAGGLLSANIEGSITYENLSFTYPEAKEPAVSGIDLQIRAGETVALVGHSGAGKSTLTDLLLGFWQAETGRILVDGIDLKEYSLSTLRSHIGVVSQETLLFDDTVKNNILFGNPHASDESVFKAAQAAYAHEFISEMPQGYDTQIGERGVKLSGGQKQRLSLARAIIKNPRILILDEATSSLDSDSEMKIQKALENILPGRTTLVIAHRLSTVKKADRIVVMEKGRIIQTGKHDELSLREGTYRELYELQLGRRTD